MSRAQCFISTALLFGGVAGCGVGPEQSVGDEELGESEAALQSLQGQLVAYGGRCLDVRGNGWENRTPVQIGNCSGGLNQSWSMPTGTGPITSLASGRVLDAPYAHDYSTTWIFDYWGGSNQQWTMPSVELLGLADKCADVPFPTDGSVVWLYQCWGGANQQWRWDGSRIQTGDGRCLAASGTHSGAAVLARTCAWGVSDQGFTLWSGGIVQHTASGKCVDVRGGNATDRTPLQLYDCNGTPAQRWRFRGELVGHASKCLQLPVTSSGIDSRDGTEPQLFSCNGGAHQKWELRW